MWNQITFIPIWKASLPCFLLRSDERTYLSSNVIYTGQASVIDVGTAAWDGSVLHKPAL